MMKVIGFPGRYAQGPGALKQLGSVLSDMERSRPLVVCDAFVAEHMWPDVALSLQASGLEATHIVFPGECTRATIAQLSSQAKPLLPDTIVALGGGKTIDTAKGLAADLGLPIVICPTIASSDAPTNRLIVLYDDNHKVVGVDYLKMNPSAVIVDTRSLPRRRHDFLPQVSAMPSARNSKLASAAQPAAQTPSARPPCIPH
ncbi:iron-containing alcohol dehydrogenase [Xanthomonas campestris]|uniref:iron-containing alcohol dehydrogenase n=1 Tax=Xanthomonas campestris TaxID=339 RepID=UPI003D06FAB6